MCLLSIYKHSLADSVSYDNDSSVLSYCTDKANNVLNIIPLVGPNFQPPGTEGLTYSEVEIVPFAGCKPQKRPLVKEDLESTEYADIDVTRWGRRHEEKPE